MIDIFRSIALVCCLLVCSSMMQDPGHTTQEASPKAFRPFIKDQISQFAPNRNAKDQGERKSANFKAVLSLVLPLATIIFCLTSFFVLGIFNPVIFGGVPTLLLSFYLGLVIASAILGIRLGKQALKEIDPEYENGYDVAEIGIVVSILAGLFALSLLIPVLVIYLFEYIRGR